ncbi:MAG: Fe-S cluster assembly protein SufD [Nocardioides sp.]
MPGGSGHSHGAVVPEQSRAERTRSFHVADFPPPTGREEAWRFTPVDRLGPLLRDTPSGAHLAWDNELPKGVTLSRIGADQARDLGAPAPGDRAAVLAVAHSEGATRLDIPADAVLSEPVRIRLVGSHSERVWGHLVITVGRHAKAVVVLEHEGTARFSEVVSVLVGDGADLTLVGVQEWADDTLHVAQHDIVVGRDASVRHVAVTLGGAIVRMSTNVSYAGPGGTLDAYGVYFADAGQHLEHRLFVDHEAPHCRSHVEYKGALQGDSAHTVWIGDVLIRAGAEGTDTYEVNRNLVLTDGARADSVPNLEIETGEIIGAGHASATGRFDDEQLFYLQARGIPETEARRLVVRGFFADIINRIPIAELQGHLMHAVERELAGVETGYREGFPHRDDSQHDNPQHDNPQRDAEVIA